MDPDPVNPKLLAGSGSEYGSGKNHSGSEKPRIRNGFEVKLLLKTDKISQFLKKIPTQL
jgi:hypothetical protein